MATRILVPSGVLGLGFDAEALARGVARKPDAICIDGGSTDCGPFYLGTATSKYARASTRSEWRQLLLARDALGVPLIIGSAGTCGADATVDWMYDITRELLTSLELRANVARIYCEQSADTLVAAWQAGRISALDPAPPIDADVLRGCSHVVALAGVEPLQAALQHGADIIIAGRTTDTAVMAALPLARGEDPGACWHAAKIAECGALCSTHPTSGVILVDIDAAGFSVEPLADGARCTPHSVSAHMLYENSDPFHLYEPGGMLDVTEASYTALDDVRVHVTGSRWLPDPDYTVKLEGAHIAGYQSTILAVLRNRHYVRHARDWLARLELFLAGEIASRMGLTDTDYTLEFRLIGVDAVFGELEHRHAEPVEVGVLGIMTAGDADTADEIARLINPFVLHYPLTDDEELPTFAFPYSPAQSSRGPLYEFSLNHRLHLDDALDSVRICYDSLGGSGA